MSRLSIISVLFFIATCTTFAQKQAAEIRKEFLNTASKNILVASHRAVHHELPENSIPAIKEGIRLGIDLIETDVKVSKDGIPMLMHDGKVDRTTNGKGNLEDQTYEELRKLRLVVKGKITDEKIPTLEEALTVAKGKILVDLDLKTSNIQPVIEVIKKTGTKDMVFFFDSDYEILAKVDAADKQYMLMPRAYSYAMADSALKLFQPEVVHIDSKFYTSEVTSLIKNKHARVWINALGEPDEEIRKGNAKNAISELIKNGADVIQTDEPEKMIMVLKEMGRHK
ncbi:glycerophosphodiester phosphodiesterase family protein [Dyadobacter subterraneus]|uniref:Glycerophosphodiester phosphodiesterase family protein n=1 Tax=Dyadobacter subterraneus TaxID=2773304 RepID=A0ABR9WI04_9BACT|nr:glycerophosphodiester phosphodiesterase family protein [Dyadobacter subterraneus]MBE9465146.1 glycerophosphodiester phosphodiesterase family protein [Dyadobacter subterraneus]